MKEYPQIRKTGFDAVHVKLPTEGLYHEENVNCNVCVLMAWKGPKVGEGMVDFVEDFLVGVKLH